MNWRWAALACLSCATARTPAERTARLQDEAGRCISYEPFRVEAARVQEALNQLGPDALLNVAQQLAGAKQRCAREVLMRLADSAAGASDYRRELESLARDFRSEALPRLVRDVLGPRADELQAEVALARAGTEVATVPERLAPAPHAECGGAPVERLACLRQAGGPPEQADRIVGDAEPALDALPAAARLEGTAQLYRAALGVASGRQLAALKARLDAGCLPRLQLVASLQAAGQSLRAASLATPCRDDEAAKRVISSGVEEANRRQAAAIRAGRTFAAWMWGGISAQLSQSPPPHRPKVVSPWPLEGTCIADAEMPEPLGWGLAAHLAIRCERRAPSAAKERPQTFDGEAEAEREVVSGEVRMACGARVRRFPLQVSGTVISLPGTSPERAALAEVGNALRQVAREADGWCRQQHQADATEGCITWAALPDEEAEQRFAQSAVMTRRWAPCFVERFAQRVGAELPVVASGSAELRE